MIVFVTSNEGKYFEFKKILGESLERVSIELEEIQSMDLNEISEHKAKIAYNLLKKPVIVEDTGLFLDDLKGLPGPFTKYFSDLLGKEYAIHLLRDRLNRGAQGRCVITYFDGLVLKQFEGIVSGVITEKLTNAKDKAFGFDYCFVPEGYTQTFAEMGNDEKTKISHRGKAVLAFSEWWKNKN